MSEEWSEPLPDQCPPSDAQETDGEKFYRLVNSIPATDVDFQSHRLLFPHQIFGVGECQARSLSLSNNLEKLIKSKKIGSNKSRSVALVTLPKGSGVIKQTGKNHHWSWWRRKSFDPLNHAEKVEL
jgi:hypothetical protein